MKLRIQTLTGQTQEVESVPQDTILDLKKIIYNEMKISKPVLVMKDQQVLDDVCTLEEHEITDGSTVNIDVKQFSMVGVRMKLGPGEFTCSVPNSMRAHNLKNYLVDGGCVGFRFNDFSLMVSGFLGDILLKDELPLHLCGIEDKSTVKIIGGRITIKLVSKKGKSWYKTFSRSITLAQMKQTILSTDSMFSAHEDKNLVKDLWLFVHRSPSYEELDHEAPIGSKLSDSDVVYFIEDKFYPEEATVTVHYEDEDDLERRKRKIGSIGYSVGDTVLSVKLRLQAQFGFPVKCMWVRNSYGTVKNDKIIENGVKYKVSVE